MGQFPKSIALLALLFLGTPLVHGEPAEASGVSPVGASPAFADSFGLNFSRKPRAARDPAVSSPAAIALRPAADSFGLNKVLVSATPNCSTEARTAAKAAAHRCIEI